MLKCKGNLYMFFISEKTERKIKSRRKDEVENYIWKVKIKQRARCGYGQEWRKRNKGSLDSGTIEKQEKENCAHMLICILEYKYIYKLNSENIYLKKMLSLGKFEVI